MRYAGAVAGRRAVRLLSGESLGGSVVEVPGPERRVLPVPGCDCGTERDRTLPVTHVERDLEEALARAGLVVRRPLVYRDGRIHGHVVGECDRVVVGMDCIVDDTLYNRVGTFPIAATAAQVEVPVTVIGAGSFHV